MKKKLLGLLFFMFSLGSVGAQNLPGNLERGSGGAIEIIQRLIGPFFAALLGGNGLYLFERILFLLIIVAVVYSVISKIPKFEDNNAIIWIITLSVSFLSTRFLLDEYIIQTVLLPYTALGVAITAILPLVIYFYFVQAFESSTIRKVLWIFFIIGFFGLWFSRYSELGQISWIYFFTGIAALIFLFADGTIRRLLLKQQMAQLGIQQRSDFERKIRRDINQVDVDISTNVVTPSQGRKIKKRLQKQLKAILKN